MPDRRRRWRNWQGSVNPERLGNHPMPLTRRDLENIYRQAFRPIRDPERQACLDIWRYYGA